ncbi:unnamed protein product [Symbiodinium necroappetens]|uniref:Uncharacterized protein n=1 Tax=Symbiodinium necroappetens TaxID=1628268 RepID=A0A812QTB9_9DINO|nr:unnamed protein product [Symbiodinium necroappetens]
MDVPRLWRAADATVQPVLFVFRLRYDETPSRVRVLEPRKGGVDLATCTAEEAVKSNVLGQQSGGSHTKVMQTELSVGMLVHHKQNMQYTWLQGRIPTYLQALQSTSAANTYACLKKVLDTVPDLHSFASDADIPMRLRLSCTDRFTSNIAAERGLSAMFHETEFVHTFCDVHKAYSASKAGMSRVEFDVSGLLAFSLGYSEPGAVSLFHQALARIFARDLVIYYKRPPAEIPDSRESQYRDQIYQLFLPVQSVHPARAKLNAKRRYVLSYLLNGNWREHGEIQHYCQFGCCPNFSATLKLLAVYGTWALCPRQPPVFPRSRWTRYDECVDYCGVLEACHGLLGKLVAELSGKPVGAPSPAADVPSAQPADVHQDLDDWDDAYAAGPSVDHVQGAEEDAGLSAMDAAQSVPVPPEENTDDGEIENEWKKQKRQNKKKAAVWVSSKPFRRLATWAVRSYVFFVEFGVE